ncbi:MAG TPA: secretin N-terminal domain-containing protein [Phycisphaerales bacterium]|nr:secretin N-terminal domain-containing protein [Phycisphaerales bacterium]
MTPPVRTLAPALALILLAGLPASAQPREGEKPGTPSRPAMTRPPQPSRQPDKGVPPTANNGQPRPGNTPAAGQPQPNQPGRQPGAGNQPGAQPGNQPAGGTLTPAPEGAGQPQNQAGESEMVYLPAFAEPVQLSSLIELVARTLQINVAVQGDVPGTVVFNAPIPVRRNELIPLLDRLLEQQNYTITRDEFGIYTVHPIANIGVQVGDDLSTTRVIRTPNVRPSSLQQAISAHFTAAGQPPTKYTYVDDLGIILATDTPRRLAALERLVDRLVEETGKTSYTRLELRYLAASVARQRALELVGALAQRTDAGIGQPSQPGVAPAAAGRTGNLDNLSDRLIVDPQGNALIFRGQPEEIARVQQVLEMIDVPNNLTPKNYAVGTWAASIANIARSRGLGEITTINESAGDAAAAFNQQNLRQQQGLGQGQQGQITSGGPVMVVDETRGTIIYYATEPQHQQMDALIREIDPQSERVIIGVYKLRNSEAAEVAAVIDAIINNSQVVGSSPLLPGNGQAGSGVGRSSSRVAREQFRNRNNPAGGTRNPATTTQAGEGELSLDGEGYVVADEANNQILVKAPAGQQREFARLIEKLDQRRAQVYIEAKIVSVTWSDDLRLAFETQLINANGSGGVLNTNFGLSSFATGNDITGVKTVATGLGGLTAAVIKSDQVPIIMHALQTKVNSRILSAPQLLVDDNEEAEIVSVDSQPTATTTQTTGNPSQTSFGGYEDAGTTLRVTPHISDGGYMGLEYEVILSSFTGSATANLPPPKAENRLTANSVTIPADTTVIVGGLNFKSDSLTRAQIPLLGDIPLLGLLFQDRRDNDRTTTLYVFLTPRILRDPTFQDLRILTRGPQSSALQESELPPLRRATIDVLNPVLPPRMPAAFNQPAVINDPAPAPIDPPAPIPLPDEQPAPAMLHEERPRETKGRPDHTSPETSDPNQPNPD